MAVTTGPESILEPRYEFKEVTDNVNSLVWLPNSACEILVATEDNVIICDTRSPGTINKFIDEGNCK